MMDGAYASISRQAEERERETERNIDGGITTINIIVGVMRSRCIHLSLIKNKKKNEEIFFFPLSFPCCLVADWLGFVIRHSCRLSFNIRDEFVVVERRKERKVTSSKSSFFLLALSLSSSLLSNNNNNTHTEKRRKNRQQERGRENDCRCHYHYYRWEKRRANERERVSFIHILTVRHLIHQIDWKGEKIQREREK